MPLLWASCEKGKRFRSRNPLEEGLLLFRRWILRKVFVVVLAEQGFGCAELACW